MRTDPELSERLLELAKRKGAANAEVYQSAYRMMSADVRDGKAEAVETARSVGYSLRVVSDGRLGFSFSTDRGALESVAEAAVESSRYTERDECLDLPGPAEAESPELFDPRVASLSEEDAVRLACLVERSALDENKKIKRIRKSSASLHIASLYIANTKGVSCGYSATSVGAQIMAVAEDGPDSQIGWDFQRGRFLQDVSFEGVGKTAARRALRLLGARRISAGKAPVLLDGSVASSFLSVFAAMLSSEAVQKGKSLLRGKVGQRVISECIDIIDDGLMRHAPGSRPVDDEGVPVRKKELVGRGVLKGFMYNTLTASREKVRSTGNAVRGAFSALPAVRPINLYLASSEAGRPLDKMISETGDGLYVTDAMGMHTANPVSGEFSVGVSGVWIEGGAFAYPVREAAISGNLLDFFSRAEAVGDDLRFYGSVGSPSVLFGPIDISA